MTGHTDAVNIFNTWFGNNYDDLLKYCKKYHIESDLLNETYLNVHDRIQRSGFTQTYFKTYILRSLRNLQINEGKKTKGRFIVDFDNEDYETVIEDKLQEKDTDDLNSKQYQEDLMYFSKKLFEYLMTGNKYTDEYNFVFRCYYLMNGRMTYAKLHAMTGIDKSKCTRIIKTMKKDIRQNFFIWLRNGK